jgi:hypothetical protein
VVADQLRDRPNVNSSFEVQLDLAEPREPQLKFRIEVKLTCSLDAPRLNFAIGARTVDRIRPLLLLRKAIRG